MGLETEATRKRKCILRMMFFNAKHYDAAYDLAGRLVLLACDLGQPMHRIDAKIGKDTSPIFMPDELHVIRVDGSDLDRHHLQMTFYECSDREYAKNLALRLKELAMQQGIKEANIRVGLRDKPPPIILKPQPLRIAPMSRRTA